MHLVLHLLHRLRHHIGTLSGGSALVSSGLTGFGVLRFVLSLGGDANCALFRFFLSEIVLATVNFDLRFFRFLIGVEGDFDDLDIVGVFVLFSDMGFYVVLWFIL